jgi:mxaJ protein
VLARVLRVCADPNNLPFSNDRLEGFENRIADIVAEELERARRVHVARAAARLHPRDAAGGASVTCRRRAEQLRARPADAAVLPLDVRVRVPDGQRPRHPLVRRSAALRTLRIGVQVIGDDYANSPPAHALGNRGIVDNVVGFSVLGDYSRGGAARADHGRRGGRVSVDVAVVWGPLAGWYARRHDLPVELVPVEPQIDVPFLPFVFDIAMGVRHGHGAQGGARRARSSSARRRHRRRARRVRGAARATRRAAGQEAA